MQVHRFDLGRAHLVLSNAWSKLKGMLNLFDRIIFFGAHR